MGTGTQWESAEKMNVYFELLREWCDALADLQIREKSRPELMGGILCPSCARVHGRCADAIYPMLYLYRQTGEEKYKDCAMRLFSWSDNMYHEEGFFYNDTNSAWRGITVFSAACLGECLLDFGDLLSQTQQTAFRERFVKCAIYLREHIVQIGGNINYPVTCAYTMAVAHALTGEEAYRLKARELGHRAMEYFTEDGLLFGEGHNRLEISPKGCRPVDIGYNVEESLPSLYLYALMEKDEEIRLFTEKAMRTHLEFMLPDGAWDNSFGTRNYKWSYWGSRTSDGCLCGFGLSDDLVCQEAVRRNFLLLKRCTKDGLLCGGPMFADAGEPTCVHHTICHAKGLAMLLQKASSTRMETLCRFEEKVPIPSDLRDGIRFFQSVQTLLLGKGDWRATITGYDVEYCRHGHASGGAVSLLWHKSLGPVLAGTMGEYQLVEPNNMQLLRSGMPACLTPRLEYQQDGQLFRSIYEKKACLRWEDSAQELRVHVSGRMAAADDTFGEWFELNYRMDRSTFEIGARCGAKTAVLILPVISAQKESVSFEKDGRGIAVTRETGAVLSVHTDAEWRVDRIKKRDFSPVGGIQAFRMQVAIPAQESAVVRLF